MEQTANSSLSSFSTVKRTPLAERQPRTRQSSTNSKTSKTSDHHRHVTHSRNQYHEWVHLEGQPSVLARPPAPSPRVHDDIITPIAEDKSEDSKRDSQISTTSTISTNRGKRKTHIGPWQLGRTLGKGATGRVRLAKHAFTGQTAAVKIVSKKSAAMVQSASMRRMDNEAMSNIAGTKTMPFGIEREIVIMKLIEHPNIISLYDIWENRGELYLVLEYVQGGELFDYVMRNGALPEAEAVRLLRQLVAGLAYCHRFNICHRDLKPENILLDQDHNIKIADFGMAALQPNGQYLTTSCGSPHYAAPEIIAGRRYSGNETDIWSVGIILYAMLNGFLPFDGGDLPKTLALVRKGEYYLSPNLSAEAADLIQHILQKRPENRITINEIWRHPLLKKYEKLHASLAMPHKLVGPPSPLTAANCGPQRIKASNIDRELLRNLQILWHGLSEEEVIARLTSNQPNHEKLFYWALIKFREEQLENYPGDPLQYSASDHHHIKQSVRRLSKSATRSALHQRRNSQFSIVSEDSLTRPAYYKNSVTAASKTTQGSYDPYRASRTPIGAVQKQATTVSVRQSGSHTSLPPLPDSTTLLDSHKRASSIPHIHSMNSSLARQKRPPHSTASSHSSLASSHNRRIFKKSTSYRRNIMFQHSNQSSSYSSGGRKDQNSSMRSPIPLTQEPNQPFSDSQSTPTRPSSEAVPQNKRPASDLDLYGTKPAQTTWRDDTRKVSAELSKICEEAFNRSSVSYTSDLSQQIPLDSPATTISVPQCLLPKLIASKPVTITPALRDLIERRHRIIDTWGNSDPKILADLIETLDRRIAEEYSKTESRPDLRAVSDPTTNKGENSSINSSALCGKETAELPRSQRTRAATHSPRTQNVTIRMVTPDPATPASKINAKPSKATPVNSLKGGTLERNRFGRIYDSRPVTGKSLDPILEDSSKLLKSQDTPEARKWSWLGKKSVPPTEGLPPTPPRKDTPKEKRLRLTSSLSSSSSETQRNTAMVEETEAKKRRWFQRVFSKRPRDHHDDQGSDDIIFHNEKDDFETEDDLFTPVQKKKPRRYKQEMPHAEALKPNSSIFRSEQSQNWFAKVFHLKPATSIIVMQISKAQARKETVKILREWRKYGIRDVAVEKRPTGDIIRARVDEANYLRIRPVQFYANVYAVLERGKSASLSVIKFTQEKGAASSFHRVVKTIGSVLNENDLTLLDQERRKKILKSMKEAGL